MSTRAEQKAKREEEILEVSLTLFARKGYAATKTSEISKALNISEGLLFHYFKTKESLLEKLVEIALSRSDGWTMPNDMEPIEYFEQAATSVINCLKEDDTSAYFFILIAQLKQNEGIPKEIRDRIRMSETENVEAILTVIKKGQMEGTIRQGNPYALMYLFSNTLQSMAVQYASNPDMPFPEVEWLLDMVRK